MSHNSQAKNLQIGGKGKEEVAKNFRPGAVNDLKCTTIHKT